MNGWNKIPTAVVTGGKHGLGAEIVEVLRHSHNVIIFDREDDLDVRDPVSSWSRRYGAGFQSPDADILINCAGVNFTDWLEDLDETTWDTVMDVNAKGIYMMSRWLLPALAKNSGTILNIVSNASHTPMRTSLAYNASKGAAHIMTLQMARELTLKFNMTVFGISPNKLAGTDMSRAIERQVCAARGWTPEQAAAYQASSLVTGEETDPKELAEFIGYLLSTRSRHKFLSGCILPYGA